ncbi:hypothetical protein IQ13_3211 [Lacibacter cauensis]|uniref:Uncharacterized protein n=1 Tax=Lacibacter cauensis TaxID=510947 RepID=A0A562SHG0_9BACT|nr:hypothetical protein [Lacibacter cauensis]TWI80533.1 hypothetical protein IQ13_3211 [Lacibacter cauensis]
MTRIAYLGSAAAQKNIPGVLSLPKDYHDMTDEEFELYLAKQRIEIEKKNAQAIGSPYASRYDASLATINRAIENIDNPDAIIGMADEMIGKAKAKGKQSGAGKLLKKVGTGLKKAAKTVAKVVTAPVRLVAKGALEIYLPKAAPMFLYLFTPAGAKLPDLMARKKAKVEKLRKFIVNGIGMKDPHFMAIIRNNLTKRFGKSPESYLAERLAKRVSGIAGNRKHEMRTLIGKAKAKAAAKKPAAKKTAKAVKKAANAPVKAPVVKTAPATIVKKQAAEILKQQLPKTATAVTNLSPVAPTSDKKEKKGFFKKLTSSQNENTKLTDVVSKAGSGDLVGTALSAISWLIEKISSVFKGEKAEKFTADDMPDIERDASDAFSYQDLENDFSNLNDQQKKETKEVATDIIETIKALPPVAKTIEKIEMQVKEKLPYLKDEQVKEIAEEIEEGPEALDESEGKTLGTEIKRSVPNGTIDPVTGGGGRNMCNC